MSEIVLPTVAWVATGCTHARPSRFVIPSHCVAINSQSFTQPCQQQPNGKIVGNGVVITASCLAPQAAPIGMTSS